MRKALIVGLLTLSVASSAAADQDTLPPWTHLRPLSPSAIDLVWESMSRSSIVEDLLRQLEETGVVVYLTDSMPGAVAGPVSHLVYLSNDETTRYLLVRIDRWRSTPFERIALLAHELQHALEVAAAPEVRDAQGLAKLYRRIGWENQKDKFETEAAQMVGAQVRKQLTKGPDRRRAALSVATP
ncbi:MAG: hypothetical protein K1Y01_12980 [Vicinamibacteria bacterium]|nr:hypothetical protein [Vicinamibacteria bacterium]